MKIFTYPKRCKGCIFEKDFYINGENLHCFLGCDVVADRCNYEWQKDSLTIKK